jgi:leucine dehydrogenase
VVVADIDKEKVEEAIRKFQVKAVEPEDIYGQEVDIFAPHAARGGYQRRHRSAAQG